MAANNYYFFTDTNRLLAQTTNAFGPIPKPASAAPTDPDEYRVTSLHTSSVNPPAYAPCNAMVCVQRVNATVVNIILKPRVQPALNFAPIKYILYKGILASSLVNGTETAAAANNDLTGVIWDTQAKKNLSAGTSVHPPAEALGIGMTAAASPDFADTESIDNLFYHPGVSFQPPPVAGGDSLGLFDKDKFGIDVLMEGLNFHHPISLARTLENRISVPALTGNESPAQRFDHWHAKEQVLGFMDPCAFYGSFFRAGLQAKTSGATPFVPKSGNALYQDVLFQFLNRNTAYLDIRNEYGFSFDYFKNYGTSLVLNGNPTSPDPSPIDYYASKWPILTLTGSRFPATHTTTARNAFRIQMPAGDNPQPLIYVSQGYRDVKAKGNGFPAELVGGERFFADFEPPVGGYTTTKKMSGLASMTFVVPNVTGLAATTLSSCYIRIKYFKRQQGVLVEPTVIQATNYLDNLVYPLDLRILPRGSAATKTSVYDEEIYVNAQNVAGLQFDFVANIGIARDADNTSFWVVPTCVRTVAGQASALVTLSGETSESPSYPDVVASKYPQVRLRKGDLRVSANDTVAVADFVSDADPAANATFAVPDFRKLLALVVANTTYDSWKSRLTTSGAALDNRFRIYLGVKNLEGKTDIVGAGYTSFELVLRGFALDAVTGGYRVQEMSTDPAAGTANVTLYAPGPDEVTCSITSGADAMSTACVPVEGSIQLTAVPSSGSGTYQWSTTSPRIMLDNTATTQTVKVTAKNQVSPTRGAEKVQLVFTPTGGTALPPVTRDVSVISVAFSASATQNYGFDDMDGATPHVSVRRQRFTTVHVDVAGGGTADDLEFSSDDGTVADVAAPPPGSFELTIAGKNVDKAETGVKAICKGGPVSAALRVNVYREVTIAARVAKIFDPGSSQTTLSFPRLDMAKTEALVNTAYKSAVVVIKLEDASPTGDPVPLAYDKDGSGKLLLVASESGPEFGFVKDELGIVGDFDPTVTPTPVIVVKDVTYLFLLAKSAAKGDKTLLLKWGDATLNHLKDGATYVLGVGTEAEPVTIKSRDLENALDFNGDGVLDAVVFTLESSLTKPHDDTDGLVRPIGGIRTFPLLVVESGSPDQTSWVIGHEIGHLPQLFGFRNVVDPTNLMHEDQTGTDHRLRFDQWESVTRT